MMSDVEKQARALRFRLQRQGMVELDAWLAPLLAADFSDVAIRQAITDLLAHETPQLQAMMQGTKDVPTVLQVWLECKR